LPQHSQDSLQQQQQKIENYRISRPIKRTLNFSLEILEKIMMNVF
jgi:hypothetical protein